jgi:outer membrane protein assembly factor BamB
MGKVSFFSLDGRFLNELKHSVMYGGGQFYPIGNKYAGMGYKQENNKFFITIDIYNSELKKEKEVAVYSIKAGYDGTVLEKNLLIQTFENKILVAISNRFLIDVYDDKGKKIHEIYQDYDNIKFTKKHKEEILDWYKSNPITKNLFYMVENSLRFPSSFPAIKKIFVTDGKVYVQTYLKKDKKAEFFVFNINGKLLKKFYLPIVKNNLLETFHLFCIKNRKLYQLIEDDEEIWHIDVLDII